jgi:hypothetical protein
LARGGSIVWRTLQNSPPLNAAPPRVAFSQHKQENHSSFLSTISTMAGYIQGNATFKSVEIKIFKKKKTRKGMIYYSEDNFCLFFDPVIC